MKGMRCEFLADVTDPKERSDYYHTVRQAGPPLVKMLGAYRPSDVCAPGNLVPPEIRPEALGTYV